MAFLVHGQVFDAGCVPMKVSDHTTGVWVPNDDVALFATRGNKFMLAAIVETRNAFLMQVESLLLVFEVNIVDVNETVL